MAKPLQKFGDYYLIKKIATGGMAEIFLARARAAGGPDRFVALKMIHPRYIEEGNFHRMIVEEAKIAVQLNHPNIGHVFDLGKHEGRYFIVMEFIDGYDLSRLQEISREKELQAPLDIVAFVGREVCSALKYAHSRKDHTGQALDLIHRDISPQNILVGFDGEVKIIDFGIAKVSTRLQQTHAGVIKGKFYYMSPEQAGAGEVDQRSDLFSLGICLWETACGRPLFRREGGPTNPLAILHEIRTIAIPRVREFRPECPKDLDEIIAIALSRDLSGRFQSAQQMQAAFNRYLMHHAPQFQRGRVAEFMVQAFEKEETSKEMDRPSTDLQALMTRGEFFPTEHSVIFSLHKLRAGKAVLKPTSDTRILAHSEPLQTSPGDYSDTNPGLVSGITNASSHGGLVEATTDRDISQITDDELALSDTVFIQKAEVEAMRQVGTAPTIHESSRRATNPEIKAISDSDPNGQTYMLASKDIQAANQTHVDTAQPTVPKRLHRRSISHQVDPPLTFTTHPLFRVLVIGLLVLCILSATLWLMLVNRSRQYDTMLKQRQQQIEQTQLSTPEENDVSLSKSTP